MGDRYSVLPESVTEYIQKESARQDQLADQLKPWVQPEEGEQ